MNRRRLLGAAGAFVLGPVPMRLAIGVTRLVLLPGGAHFLWVTWLIAGRKVTKS